MANSKAVLIDAGYFIGRQGRWWSPKGSVRRAYNRWQRTGSNPDFFKFRAAMKKAIRNDISYLGFRIRQMGFGSPSTRVVLCYDGTEGCNARTKLFPPYKQNRRSEQEDPDEERKIPDIRQNFADLGFNPDEMGKGWEALYETTKEADDLLAEELARIDKKTEVLVMSADSDLFQCWNLHPKVRIHNFQVEILKKEVEKKLGIPISKYADWKAIAGDASDNIPGVPNLGGTAAATLLRTYKGLEDIPEEYLTTVVVSDPAIVTTKLSTFRAEQELSMAATVREHGDYWRRVEKQQSASMRGEQYKSMEQVLDGTGVLVTNHKDSCLTFRQIIALPFVG
jgi:5'-3' exonuclease